MKAQRLSSQVDEIEESLQTLTRESEEALLGSNLVNPASLKDEPVSQVAAGHFFIVRHRWVFQAIKHLASENRPIDLLTVAQELERMGRFEEAGGHPFLTNLVHSAPNSVHAPEYARAVLQHAETRSLKGAADELLKLACSTPNGSSRWAAAQGILDRYIEDTPSPAGGILTYAELQALHWDDDPQLVPDLIPTSGTAAISGDTGAGKTFEALDAHMAVAEAGRCFGGRQVTKGGPTLYLGIDNSTRTLQKRARGLAIGRGIDPDVDGFHLYQDPLDFSNNEGAATLRRLITEIGAVLVSIDMFSRYIGKADLNRMDEVGPPLMRLRRIADETGAAILLLLDPAECHTELQR